MAFQKSRESNRMTDLGYEADVSRTPAAFAAGVLLKKGKYR